MTNLERAAAIAAEQGVPLVGPYRGWDIYMPGPFDYAGACPHELDIQQFLAIEVNGEAPMDESEESEGLLLLTEGTLPDLMRYIDDFEAAREAMPATAFFGVEEEVGI